MNKRIKDQHANKVKDKDKDQPRIRIRIAKFMVISMRGDGGAFVSNNR